MDHRCMRSFFLSIVLAALTLSFGCTSQSTPSRPSTPQSPSQSSPQNPSTQSPSSSSPSTPSPSQRSLPSTPSMPSPSRQSLPSTPSIPSTSQQSIPSPASIPDSTTGEESTPSSDQGDQPATAGGTPTPPSTDPTETPSGEGDDGWETATELPGEEIADTDAGMEGTEESGTSESAGDGSAGDQSIGATGTEDQPGGPSSDDEGVDPGRSGDDELERALDVFDGEILEGRKIVLARSNDHAGQSQRVMTSGIEPTTPGGGTNSGGGSLPDTAPPQTDTRGIPMPGPVAAVMPTDIPDAKDDDVVARQLREAAMAETDPDLRQALWDDYRRYKSGS